MSHCVCPDCGNGWTFDFQQRRVYCRTCEEAESADAVARTDGDGQSGPRAQESSSSSASEGPQTGASK